MGIYRIETSPSGNGHRAIRVSHDATIVLVGCGGTGGFLAEAVYSVSIETGLPTQIGASNATAGNVAGATNSTISIVAPNMSAAPGVQSSPELAPRSQSEASTQNAAVSTSGFEFGAASFEGSLGASQLFASRQQQRPARTITNEDINRLNQQNGTVQFRGKTEKIE